jgi:hypothetical protein
VPTITASFDHRNWYRIPTGKTLEILPVLREVPSTST